MNGAKDKIFVFGASGHAKVVIDVLEHQGRYDIAFLADDDPHLKERIIYGYRVLGGRADLLAERGKVSCGIVAIGDNAARSRVASWLRKNGFCLVSAVHPSAQIARGTEIGAGTAIMAGAVVNSDAMIGDNAIINTRASVDHDCVVGNGAHIAPGATLCGAVCVGDASFICAGATIVPEVTVGKNVVVGAGSLVLGNLPDGVTAVGSPARRLRS